MFARVCEKASEQGWKKKREKKSKGVRPRVKGNHNTKQGRSRGDFKRMEEKNIGVLSKETRNSGNLEAREPTG